MTPKEIYALDKQLDRFLEDVIAPLGRSERRRWAKIYLQGLLLDGERKSIEPMAARVGGADVQSLRQFVGQSPWAVEAVQRGLARKVVDLLAEPEVWMIDETSFPKAGDASVGVARQYWSLGQNRQLPGGRQPALEHRRGQLSVGLAAVSAGRVVGHPGEKGGRQDSRGYCLSE